MLVEKVAAVFRDRREVRRFIGRRSIDKSCGEVVHNLDPNGPISDETMKIVETIDKPNFLGEEAASQRADELHDEYCARAAIEAVFDWLAEPGDEAVLDAVEAWHKSPALLDDETRSVWTAMLAAMRKEALGG